MARGKSNQKKGKRKFSTPLAIGLTILLAIMTSTSISAFEWLRDGFLGSSIFTLRGVSIQGNSRITSADILDVSGLHVGTDNIHSIMSHVVEKRIKARFSTEPCALWQVAQDAR